MRVMVYQSFRTLVRAFRFAAWSRTRYIDVILRRGMPRLYLRVRRSAHFVNKGILRLALRARSE